MTGTTRVNYYNTMKAFIRSLALIILVTSMVLVSVVFADGTTKSLAVSAEYSDGTGSAEAKSRTVRATESSTSTSDGRVPQTSRALPVPYEHPAPLNVPNPDLLNPAGPTLFEASYFDNHRRNGEGDNTVTQSQMVLTQSNYIQHAWGGTVANRHPYGEHFGSVVGVRGTFTIRRIAETLEPVLGESGISSSWVTLEFAAPGNTTPFVPRQGPALITHGDQPRTNRFNITFNEVGTWRVSVFTRQTTRTNPDIPINPEIPGTFQTTYFRNWWVIRVRNGILAQGDNPGDFSIQARFEPQNRNILSLRNHTRAMTFNLGINLEGFRNISPLPFFVSPASVEILNSDDEDVTGQLFAVAHPTDGQVVNNRILRITRIEDAVIPNGNFRVRSTIRYTYQTINQNGALVQGQNDVVLYAWLQFTPPATRSDSGMSWWPLFIGIGALAVLGGGWFLANYLIAKSQGTHVGRLERRRDERARMDELNAMRLRAQAEDDNAPTPDEEDEYFALEAKRIFEEIEMENKQREQGAKNTSKDKDE